MYIFVLNYSHFGNDDNSDDDKEIKKEVVCKDEHLIHEQFIIINGNF